MPIPSLPNELVDQILSYGCLKEEDLFETALVHSSWLEPSRKSMYQAAEIHLIPISRSSNNPYPIDSIPPRYGLRTWQLLATVTQNTELASIVKKVHFRGDPRVEMSQVATSPRATVVTVMNIFRSATSFRFDSDEWFEPDLVALFYPHFDELQSISFDLCHGLGWFLPISKLRNLRSLNFQFDPAGTVRLNQNNPTESLTSRLERLLLSRCSFQQFNSLSIGSGNSLRNLKIPLNVLPRLILSDYPMLKRLEIVDSSESPTPAEVKHWLISLQSSRIVVIDLSLDVFEVLNKDSTLHLYLPASCTRLNLDELPTFESVLSLFKSSYRRISQLGLPMDYADEEVEKVRFEVAGLRAVTEEAGVDIIWTENENLW